MAAISEYATMSLGDVAIDVFRKKIALNLIEDEYNKLCHSRYEKKDYDTYGNLSELNAMILNAAERINIFHEDYTQASNALSLLISLDDKYKVII